MSAPDSRLNRPGMARPSPLHTFVAFVDAGAVLQKAIQRLAPFEKSGIILRCDELARLQISEQALLQVFTQLLQMIISERADVKLFLHITCAKEQKPDQAAKTQVASYYLIQFHTNLTPHAAWMREAESRTNSIASLLQPFSGRLVVNQLKNSGCVFVIALPGK